MNQPQIVAFHNEKIVARSNQLYGPGKLLKMHELLGIEWPRASM
jgi:hypothetical protein